MNIQTTCIKTARPATNYLKNAIEHYLDAEDEDITHPMVDNLVAQPSEVQWE